MMLIMRTAGMDLPTESFPGVNSACPENGPILQKLCVKCTNARIYVYKRRGPSELTLGRENDRIVIRHLSRRVSQFMLRTRWRIDTCYSIL